MPFVKVNLTFRLLELSLGRHPSGREPEPLPGKTNSVGTTLCSFAGPRSLPTKIVDAGCQTVTLRDYGTPFRPSQLPRIISKSVVCQLNCQDVGAMPEAN